MSNTDGPAMLRKLIEDLRDSDSPLSRTQATIYTDDMARLRELAAAWDAEREQAAAARQYTCAEHKDEARKGGACVWCQLAADRAARENAEALYRDEKALREKYGVQLVQATADRADLANAIAQNEQLIKATGCETFTDALDRIAADRAEIASCLENIRELAAQRAELRVKLEEAYKALEVIGTRKDTAEAALAQARALLNEFYDNSPCRLDYHGYCQEHNSMTEVCIMRRVAAALEGGDKPKYINWTDGKTDIGGTGGAR